MPQRVPRSITSPKKFIIGNGMLAQLPDFVEDFGNNALIISDIFIVERVRKESIPALEQAGLKGQAEQFDFECTDEEIERLGELAKKQGANVIVGVGGGKTLDTAKAVAHYYKLPVILYPTIASTDAPCTALAVIYKKTGRLIVISIFRKILMRLLPILIFCLRHQHAFSLLVLAMRWRPISRHVPVSGPMVSILF